ncbi:hypothetical protein VTN00DRAFT_6749 [Thermoascus crustaceus]|uniref:uncharacterized protein n=1 Tax=Thermoascus crustaceus TaxID=5088 RepID=UPI003744A930
MKVVVGSLVILIVLRLIYEYKRDRRLPPGPRRLPLIGNLHQAPQELPWLTFHEWSKKYGPIFSAQFGGQTVIMITDADIAKELLDKRGSIYSDRPRMVMAGENLTKGMHLLLRRYDDRYKLHQRMEAPVLSPRASQSYHPLQDLESKKVMYDFLHTADFKKVFERYAASLVYSLAYGFRLHTGDEQALIDAHRVQDNFAYAGRVGTWIVDALPFLNHLPMALAPWKKTAEEFFQLEAALHMRNMQTGLSSKSWNWTKEFSKSKESNVMPPLELAYDVGILADAGLDTTAVQMRMFILASLAYPDFIPKAQKELDDAVGPDRLPNFEDRDRLPYIQAIVEEILRWRTIIPGGVPHATLKEDNYMGYHIPKGAMVIGLHWSMAMDERVFEKPLEFRPERWLEQKKSEDGSGTNNSVSTFGFGRRICTGRHIARNSIFILVSRLLWSFNIKHAVDQDGKRKEVNDMAFTSGFVWTPFQFEAVFEPRSEQARMVVEREWLTAEKDIDVLLDEVRRRQIKLGLDVRA